MSDCVSLEWVLPRDILGQILGILRPKSIAACTCVAKEWMDVVLNEPTLNKMMKLERVWRSAEIPPTHYKETFSTFDWAKRGEKVALGGLQGILMLSLETGEVLWRSEKEAAITISVCFFNDMLASGSGDDHVCGWEPTTGEKLFRMPVVPGGVGKIADLGDYFAIGGRHGELGTWEKANLTQCGVLEGHESRIHTLVSTNEGKMLVSGSEDHTIRVWDVLSSACVNIIATRSSCLDVSSNVIASGYSDGLIRMWGLNTGERLCPWREENIIWSLSFDGTRLVTYSEDYCIKIWNVFEKKCIRTFKMNDEDCFVRGVWINGHSLVAISDEGEILLWDCSSALESRTWVRREWNRSSRQGERFSERF